jgi:hypothetical protein
MSTTAEAMIDRADDHAEPYADATIPTATLVHLDPRALAANPDNVRTNLGDLADLADLAVFLGPRTTTVTF